MPGALMNRVAVTTPITVRSVNGPAVTTIQGVPDIGDGAVRCAYLTNGALLSGFTLTNGGTRGAGDDGTQQSGGAVWGESTSAVASNCVITSSSSGRWGGGAAFLTLLNCVVTGNYAGHGGGAFVCALTNCVLTNNSSYYGGAARDSDLDHCAINGNVSYSNGGGTVGDGLNNWQEWIAGTVPTNATSSLRLLDPTSPSVTLRWLGVTNRMYFVDRAASLQPSPSFSTVASNIPGQPGVTTFTDATAPGPGPFFYRVGVRP